MPVQAAEHGCASALRLGAYCGSVAGLRSREEAKHRASRVSEGEVSLLLGRPPRVRVVPPPSCAQACRLVSATPRTSCVRPRRARRERAHARRPAPPRPPPALRSIVLTCGRWHVMTRSLGSLSPVRLHRACSVARARGHTWRAQAWYNGLFGLGMRALETDNADIVPALTLLKQQVQRTPSKPQNPAGARSCAERATQSAASKSEQKRAKPRSGRADWGREVQERSAAGPFLERESKFGRPVLVPVPPTAAGRGGAGALRCVAGPPQ